METDRSDAGKSLPLLRAKPVFSRKLWICSSHSCASHGGRTKASPQRAERGHIAARAPAPHYRRPAPGRGRRSEEHTSELQSQSNLVCRLLLEKKKQRRMAIITVFDTTKARFLT